MRDYGLLKFTHKEAFKTWELSLAGFLVAANLLGIKRETKGSWTIPIHQKVANFDLLPEIREAWDQIQSYDDFVRRLAEICEPNASVFKTFAPALQRAFALLPKYWSTLNDHKLTQQARQQASLELIKQLETEGISDDFYAELSACIKIDDFLKGSTAGDEQGQAEFV